MLFSRVFILLPTTGAVLHFHVLLFGMILQMVSPFIIKFDRGSTRMKFLFVDKKYGSKIGSIFGDSLIQGFHFIFGILIFLKVFSS